MNNPFAEGFEVFGVDEDIIGIIVQIPDLLGPFDVNLQNADLPSGNYILQDSLIGSVVKIPMGLTIFDESIVFYFLFFFLFETYYFNKGKAIQSQIPP